MTTPPTPSQNPKTLDEVCDKPAGTFKEFVKAQDSLAALQRAVSDLENIIGDNYDAHLEGDWPCAYISVPVSTANELLSAAKKLLALQTENSEMSIELGENAKNIMALQIENEGLKASLEASNSRMIELVCDRDSLKSTLESMTKEMDTLKECNEQLVASEQSIRNEANRLRRETGVLDRKVSELEGRIANALL